MKLFWQLTEQDQNNVLHHCADLVISDMITDGVHLDPITEEEFQLKEKIEKAVEDIKQFSTKEEKTNFLLSDAVVSKAIYDIALEMAKSAFYHDDDELVIYPSSIKKEEPENLLPETTSKPKKVSPLN